MGFNQQAGGVLIGRTDKIIANKTAVLNAVLVLLVVVLSADVQLLFAPAHGFAQVVFDLRVEVQVALLRVGTPSVAQHCADYCALLK